jgi:glycosyltransferase involved in cell wall biosynthesis
LEQLPERGDWDLLVVRVDLGSQPLLRNVAVFPGTKVLLLEDAFQRPVSWDAWIDYLEVSEFDRIVGNTAPEAMAYLGSLCVGGLRFMPGLEGEESTTVSRKQWVQRLLIDLDTGSSQADFPPALPEDVDPTLYRELCAVLRSEPELQGCRLEVSNGWAARFQELVPLLPHRGFAAPAPDETSPPGAACLLTDSEFRALLEAGSGPWQRDLIVVTGQSQTLGVRRPFTERGCYVRSRRSTPRVGVYRRVITREPIRRQAVLLAGEASANLITPKYREILAVAPELAVDTLNMVRIGKAGVSHTLREEDRVFRRNLQLEPGATYEGWLLERAFDYDVVHLIGLFKPACMQAVLKLPPEVLLIVSFIGSDLYLLSDPRLYPLHHAVTRRADTITVHNDQMKTALLTKYGQDLAPRVRTVMWGAKNDQLRRLASMQAAYDDRARAEWRERQGIAPEKLLVTVGYSGAERVNHLQTIAALDALPERTKRRCSFVFPMSYGATPEYARRVGRRLERSGLEYRALRYYQTDEAIAELMLNADYHVNLPVTDAFNNFMVESLAAGTAVINGAWLPYALLDEIGIRHHKVESLDDLPSRIEQLIAQEAHRDPALAGNLPRLEPTISYEAVASAWAELYRDLLTPDATERAVALSRSE